MPANDALLHNWFYGNLAVRLVAALGFAFLMGSIPAGPVVRWLFSDLGDRTLRIAEFAIAPINALKAAIPTAIAAHGAGLAVGLACAGAAVVGHAFCPWRRGRGGTGADVALGTALALAPGAAAIGAIAWCAGGLVSRSMAVASLAAALALTIALFWRLGPSAALFGAGATLVIAARLARERLRTRENRFERKPASQGSRRGRTNIGRVR